MEILHVIVVVREYDATILAAKVRVEKIPNPGEEVEVDFDRPETEFIGAKQGREFATGKFSFTVDEIISADKFNELPTVVCQL